jgi:hypothetical protein
MSVGTGLGTREGRGDEDSNPRRVDFRGQVLQVSRVNRGSEPNENETSCENGGTNLHTFFFSCQPACKPHLTGRVVKKLCAI